MSDSHASLSQRLKIVSKRAVPWAQRLWLRNTQRKVQHALLRFRRVTDFDRLHRLRPINGDFGWSRGQCIDRYYIERFLAANVSHIQGRVLEFQTPKYTARFGGDSVTKSDVLDVERSSPWVTVVADLTDIGSFSTQYDCIICTQVLLLIYDVRTAIRTLWRYLSPGGVLLLTVPGLAHRIVRDDHGKDYWRFTALSIRTLLEEVFPADHLCVQAYGNVLAATAFLHGLAVEELSAEEMDYLDPQYEVTIAARAMKPRGETAIRS